MITPLTMLTFNESWRQHQNGFAIFMIALIDTVQKKMSWSKLSTFDTKAQWFRTFCDGLQLSDRIQFLNGSILHVHWNGLLCRSSVISFLAWLTGGNWQKWKRVFLTCPCHKSYRDEAVGLKSCKYTWKITKFVKMGNLGQ